MSKQLRDPSAVACEYLIDYTRAAQAMAELAAKDDAGISTEPAAAVMAIARNRLVSYLDGPNRPHDMTMEIETAFGAVVVTAEAAEMLLTRLDDDGKAARLAADMFEGVVELATSRLRALAVEAGAEVAA